MAAAKRAAQGKAAAQEPEVETQPVWLATRRLPVGDEMGAVSLGVAAFQPGERVPAEHVERYSWQAYVRGPGQPEPEPVPDPSEAAATVDPAVAWATEQASQPPAAPADDTGDQGAKPDDTSSTDPAADGADSSKEKP